MIQKKKFSEAIAANISVVEGLLTTESFSNSLYKTMGGNSFIKKRSVNSTCWIRVMRMISGASFMINTSRRWFAGEPESLLLYVSYGQSKYIKQIAGKLGSNCITKARFAKYADNSIYFEIYYDLTFDSVVNTLENSIFGMSVCSKDDYVGTIVGDEPTEVITEETITNIS